MAQTTPRTPSQPAGADADDEELLSPLPPFLEVVESFPADERAGPPNDAAGNLNDHVYPRTRDA